MTSMLAEDDLTLSSLKGAAKVMSVYPYLCQYTVYITQLYTFGSYHL